MDVNLLSLTAQTKNLLLKIDENIAPKEEFANESESYNKNSYYKVEIIEMDINFRRD